MKEDKREDKRGGLIPLGSLQAPHTCPMVTILIVLVNTWVFVREFMGGEAFVTQHRGEDRDPVMAGEKLRGKSPPTE